MIVFLLFILALLVVHPFLHAWLIDQQQKYIHYTLHSLYLLFALVVLSMVGLGMHLRILQILPVMLWVPFARWVIHGELLNAIRGKPFNYLGTRAKTDQLLRYLKQTHGLSPISVKLTIYFFSTLLSAYLYLLWNPNLPEA